MSRPQTHDLSNVAGVLLAGGKSSRFGAEKAAATFRGAPMFDAALRVLTDLPLLAVSAKPGSFAEHRALSLSATVLHDEPGMPSGPLTGIAAALAWAERNGLAFVASVPCDAPLLPDALFKHLAAGIGGARAAYAVTTAGPHPLCALWRCDVAPILRARLLAGIHPAARTFLADIGAAPVHFSDARAFANANTTDALAALERIA